MSWQGLIKEFLPVNENTPELTLLEGNTSSITSTLLPMDEHVIIEHLQGVKQV